MTRPLLGIYDSQLQTEVHTGASKWGIAGILLQLQHVLYVSRQTTKQEQMYHSYELETLAVVESLEQFRIYLMGIEFKVVTDCNAIRSTLNKRDFIPRIGRWWLSIQEFTFNVEYRPGHKMTHADALSRNLVGDDYIVVNNVKINEDDWVLNAQLTDHRCKLMIKTLKKQPEDKEDREIYQNYCLTNNRIYKITPTGRKWLVSRGANGHLSEDKTMSALSKLYWFPGMRRYVKKNYILWLTMLIQQTTW